MGVNPNYGSSSLNHYQAEEIYILEVNAERFYEVAVWWTTHRALSTSVSSGDKMMAIPNLTVLGLTIRQIAVSGLFRAPMLLLHPRVVIISEEGCTTCADAVRFIPLG